MNNTFAKYLNLLKRYKIFESKKIPLCAAENYLSEFVKEPLSGPFEGKYSIGNKFYNPENDFIGGEYIHELFELFNDECRKIFSCKYGDARTLSGMNCFAIAVQCVFKYGEKVLLTTPNQGGHPSVPIILKTLGINYDEIPYNFRKFEIDYEKINDVIASNKYDGIVFCQSDLVNSIDISKLKLNGEIVLFDGAQTLGMIAAKIHPNPLLQYKKTILLGGSHKTLPGPSSGLILCNDECLIKKLDVGISPSYLRNVQPNHIASLLLALIEFEEIGYNYQKKIIENANLLAKYLQKKGFKLAKTSNGFSNTHQIFILTSKEQMNLIFNNAKKHGITLNKKEKQLFNNYGIRIGVQEITRYGWGNFEIKILAQIISLLNLDDYDEKVMQKYIDILLKRKNDSFVLHDTFKE